MGNGQENGRLNLAVGQLPSSGQRVTARLLVRVQLGEPDFPFLIVFPSLFHAFALIMARFWWFVSEGNTQIGWENT